MKVELGKTTTIELDPARTNSSSGEQRDSTLRPINGPTANPPSATASPAQSNHQSSIINHQLSQSLVTSATTNWGESVEGVSVRLQAVRLRWATNETPTLTFDLQNQGRRDFNTFQLQELAQLEVDGIWYEWIGSGVWTHSPFLPGTKYEVNPVELTPDWRPKQPSASSFGPRPPLSLSPGKHIVRLAVRCFDPHAPVSKMLVTNAASSEIVVTSNPVEIEITDSAVASVEPIWLNGNPADGHGINLIEGHYAWTDEDVVGLSVGFQISVAEKIPKPGDPVPFSPSPNELEVDGVWYHWTGDSGLMSSAFPPVRLSSGCLPVSLTTNWQTRDGVPLRLTPARHTVRVASTGTETDGDGNSPIRAISNPVQINVSPGTGWRSALVKKYLPGYLFRAVRRQMGSRESMVEVLVTPAGEEIDLAAARGQWRGITSILPPAGSAAFDFPTYSHNAPLTALTPSLNLKIATAQDAEEVSRLILGLFKGWTSFEAWTTKAEPSENGWVVTPGYVGPPTQLQYQGPLELIVDEGVVKDVREEAGMPPLQASLETGNANSADPGWGEPVEGLSIRLQSDKEVWYLANDAPTLRLSVRNLGGETLAVPESAELGELEVDGVWYTWSDKYFVAHKTLPSGRQMENLAVLASSWTWRRDSTPFFAGAGKHRIRFAVTARRGTANSGQTIRAVSNPVEVEFRMGVAPKEAPASATNTPSTNAPSATASPARINLQSSESLVTSAATNTEAMPISPGENFVMSGTVVDTDTHHGIENFTVTVGNMGAPDYLGLE